MELWRLYRTPHGPGLDGIGGTFAEGRWHHRGERVVYFGSTASIVVLERLAHTDVDLLPDDLRLTLFELPESVARTAVGDLAPDWTTDPAFTRRLGSRWWNEGASCLLTVPSAILPEEFNFVLNPLHQDARLLRFVRERAFAFDPRLV